MIFQSSLCMLAVVGLSLAIQAQVNEAAVTVRIRAILHDPVHPTADLYYPDKSGAVVQLNFRPQDLTEPMFMLPVNGSLVLFIIHATPGALQPTISTIVDTNLKLARP
jgi:hypothetical protein